MLWAKLLFLILSRWFKRLNRMAATAQESGENDERVDYDQAPEKGHEFLL